MRLIKYFAAVLLGWAILWPALAGTSDRKSPELSNLASTSSDTGAVEPLVAGRSFGISFDCPENGLAALEFRVATYQRINPARLVMLLYRVGPGGEVDLDPAGRVPVRRSVIGAAGLNDWGPAKFEFKPIEDSAGARFYAVVMSPGTRVFQCVGLVMTRMPKSSSWRGYADGKASATGPATRVLGAGGEDGRHIGWWFMIAVPIVVFGIAWLRED